MRGTQVTFSSNGGSTTGYLATASDGPAPGVLVLQEWWGLVPHIEALCDRFAQAGFTALAPDLYHGQSTTSPDDAGKLFMALNIERTEKDLRGAAQYLLEHPSTHGDTVGVVGFCMGGQLALYAASKNPGIGACVDFYGIHPNVKPDLEAINAPVLGLFGETDPMVGPEVTAKLEAALVAAGKQVDFHTYAGAGHAFFNDTRPDAYHLEAATDAWTRTLAFFKEHLTA